MCKLPPNDPSSATRRTERNDCNRDAMPGSLQLRIRRSVHKCFHMIPTATPNNHASGTPSNHRDRCIPSSDEAAGCRAARKTQHANNPEPIMPRARMMQPKNTSIGSPLLVTSRHAALHRPAANPIKMARVKKTLGAYGIRWASNIRRTTQAQRPRTRAHGLQPRRSRRVGRSAW